VGIRPRLGRSAWRGARLVIAYMAVLLGVGAAMMRIATAEPITWQVMARRRRTARRAAERMAYGADVE
jgi:hypothetical protein